METWQTVLLAIGGNTTVLLVLGWLGKSFLDKVIARDTMVFELNLKAKSDAAMEHLKNDLQLATIEHEVRFSRLHEKRATVIAELYGHLVETLWEAESFLSPMEWVGEPNKGQKRITAMNKVAELYRYFDKHRIYLPPALCTSLESLVLEVRTLIIKFGVYVDLKDETMPAHTYKQKQDAWLDGFEAIKNKVPQARERLEEEFRSLLGARAAP